MSVNYDLLPPHIRAGAQNYIEDHVSPGGFLTAVICNDLVEAVAYADATNIEELHDIVAFFYCEAPSDCWGSKDAMVKWLDRE